MESVRSKPYPSGTSDAEEIEEQKEEGEEEEDQEIGRIPGKFNPELNLLDCLDMGSTQTSSEAPPGFDSEPRVFSLQLLPEEVLQFTSTWRAPKCPQERKDSSKKRA